MQGRSDEEIKRSSTVEPPDPYSVGCHRDDGHTNGSLGFRQNCQVELLYDKDMFAAKLQRIPALREKCKRIAKDASNKLEVAKQNATTTLEDFITYKAMVLESLERQEYEIMQTKETFQMQAKEKADGIVASCENIGSKLTILETVIASNQHGANNSMEIYMHTDNPDDQLDLYDNDISQLETDEVPTDIFFNVNYLIVKVAQTNEFLGKIGLVSNIPLSADTEAMKIGRVYVRAPEDEGECNVTGMTHISDNSIAITDYDNRSVKVVDTGSGKIKQRLQLTSGPWDLTTLPDNKLAVTLWIDSSIQIISTSGALQLHNTLACKEYPCGIRYHQEQLVVSYSNASNMVEILSLDGQVIRTVVSRLNSPGYLAVADGGEILVSDEDNHSVLKLDNAGQIRYTYRDDDLNEPRGIVLCGDDKFMVCSWDTDTVHLVSSNGIKIKLLLDKTYDIVKPHACLFDERKRLLYISTVGAGSVDDFIHVFKLQ